MYLPNYKDGSILNLVSSIIRSYGNKTKYLPLKILEPKELSRSKNIVLIVIDGLGYEYLAKNGKGTTLKKHLRGKMTSVLPSTTATAITTFHTGLAPEEHCITGWYMHLREIGMVSKILRFTSRLGGPSLIYSGLEPKDVIKATSLFEKLKAKSYIILPSQIINSEYNQAIHKNVKEIGYTTLNGFFGAIRKSAKSSNSRKFIFAYWPNFDDICHNYYSKSRRAYNHLRIIDKYLAKFLKSIAGTGTTVIITADHGQIDVPTDKMIDINRHPVLKDCLTLPLCGEPRFTYCYVHPSKAKTFERYVKSRLKHACTLHKSEELIRKHYFGLFKPGKRLFDRVGDYVLIAKDNYIIKDSLAGRKVERNLGNHGGVSKEEMFVPLIFIKT
jgi:predicted AlkP superfamily pyrophosphatase or phosphodiesterase